MKFSKLFLFTGLLASALCAANALTVSQVLELHIENPYISPNRDGLQDNIFFTPILKSDWSVSRWRLDIVNGKGKVVYRTTSSGFSTLIQWNGTDRKGVPLPEGVYHATLYAWGNGAQIKSDPQDIIIDTTPPLVELSVSSATNGYGCSFHPRVQESNPIERWMVQYVDLNGRTLDVFWSSGSVLDTRWPDSSPGAKLVSPGPYKAVFQAWDRAGNESAPVFTDFTVNFAGDRSVRGSLKKVRTHQTKAGLLIQLTSAELFVSRGGKPSLGRLASASLDEAALLINAYPQCPVRLDGYSFARGSAAADRDLGSLNAWMVYSYLVKQSSVQASRLTVRGRGRVVADDRDKDAPPLVKNGVEIWLLGSGPW